MGLKFNPTNGQFDVVAPSVSAGVSSIAKQGDTPLTGAVTLSEGSNITLTQVGNDIEIAASGGGASPLTTKGDLYTYSTLDTRLPVGTNGQILSANSAQTTGLQWVTPTYGDVSGPGSSTDNAIARYDGTTGKIIQNSGVLVDDNNNIIFNNYFSNSTTTTSSGGTVIMTIASAMFQILTGSSNHNYELPDATTLPSNGDAYSFNNNSSGSLVIKNTSGTTLYTVPAGGIVTVELLNQSTANGVWDFHSLAPSTVTWSSGASGLIFNTALSTTPQIITGASSATTPSFIPQRTASTTGFGGDGTNLFATIGGTASLKIASGSISPNTNDGTALGTTALQFSDLHLASGAVINFANGNSVITHSSAVLSVTTGDLRVTTAGTNSASVVTTAGTQTLTSKTIDGANNTITNVSLTTGVTGTLPVANGGTGQTSYTDGQLLIGNTTGNTLTKATLTAGSGISVTNGSGSITIAATNGQGITWNNVTGTSQSAAVNNGYISNNAGLVTVTLPSTAAVGQIVEVAGSGAGGWRIAQNSGQTIRFGTSATTTGVSGRLDSVNRYDAVRLICIVANTDFSVISSQGNITVT